MGYHSYVTRDRLTWNTCVKMSLLSEVHHTWHYHSLNREGEPLLFVVDFNGDFIALPLIKRKIRDSSFFDLTSVYGYTGPISNISLTNIPVQWKAFFRRALIDFMNAENCVCAFSRLHPFMDQHLLMNGMGEIRDNGYTVYIDLKQSLEMQRSKYHRRMLRQIRQLYKVGYIIKEASCQDEIKQFTKMYHENMDRLGASENYYFDEQYFTEVLKNDQCQSKLILIYKGVELVCGAVVFLSSDIVRNHLSATATAYLNESPSKMLTDYISIVGRTAGASIFHLGGGVGGRNDSLFTFKSYFSDLLISDKIWCYVNDKNAYNDLVLKSNIGLNDPSGYFPAYRQNSAK